MTPEQIVDRYPWISEEDAKRIAEYAAKRAAILQQELIYDEAEKLKPS